ncbi:MAG: tyrosine-type recombinase/integrase, partial [Bdellovibrionota bacterium]
PGLPSSVLFLSERGNKVSDSALIFILRRAIACVGIKKRIYPHLIRHTMATHLLANGASLMVVQKILGHIQLNTSVIYTHLDITALKEASQLFHPRGKWQWRSKNS